MATRLDRLYARAFFGQAVHDLDDAEALIVAPGSHWAGTVKASQAACEKAIKAALYISRGIGNFKLNHRPVDLLANKRIGERLRSRIRELENQVPNQHADARNPEYPSGDPPLSTNPVAPVASYTQQEANRAIETGRRTVGRVRQLYRSLT